MDCLGNHHRFGRAKLSDRQRYLERILASCAWQAVMRRYYLLTPLLLVFLCGAASFQQAFSSTCAGAYGAIPPQPLPKWLETAAPAAGLATQNRYDLLAGHLLAAGLVDGSSCPSGGLNSDGSPNVCGLEIAQAEGIAWQNRYDASIVNAAQASQVPPYLIKAVIAVESQFWPAPDWAKGEIGLGQMTEHGADLLLAYRPNYARQVCIGTLSEEGCNLAYSFQPFANQAMLRGTVLRSLDVSCSTCAGGIDPAKGDQAVAVLAETLAASCNQSARLIGLVTGKTPSAWMSYEDFWRFVLANYHAGAGCMYQALRNSGNYASWPGIASGLPSGCRSGAEYVRRIEENIKP